MRIAQISPLHESVPPQLYGGTERVVHHLTEELVRMGHEVTLYASGDSNTSARLVPVWPRALRLDPGCRDRLSPHVLMLERVLQQAHEYEVLHFHLDTLHFPLTRRQRVPHVTTLHGRLDAPEFGPLYREFGEVPVVSISDAQRRPLPHANWQATIHHGLPLTQYALQPEPGAYLAFLGRYSPEKRPDRAVRIARAAGWPLQLAAKVDPADRPYYEEVVRPLLGLPGIQDVGEVDEGHKGSFLGRAAALLFPVDWPEPFGLAMIEAMACGTPVVAFRNGSVAEVIDEGVTGFVVDSEEEAVAALGRLGELDRRRVRAVFEQRFSLARMARDYLGVYQRLAGTRNTPVLAARRGIR